MTTHHTLDHAIEASRNIPGTFTLLEGKADRLGLLAALAGDAVSLACTDPTPCAHDLAFTAKVAMSWADTLADGEPTADAVRHEYSRAHAKHHGHTPYNPAMSDDDRAAILIEEVGEVARALTPDAHTAVGHAGNLRDELIQTATMALAWLARVLDDQEATR